MNSSLDQKKASVIEESFHLKDEGMRLSFIIEKFPDYEMEIREIFGTVVFIKENNDKINASKNILKTLLSKIPESSRVQPLQSFSPKEKEVFKRDNIYVKNEEESGGDEGDNLSSENLDNNSILNKWKIIAPVIVLAIVMGIVLLRSDSRIKNEVLKEDIGIPQDSDELNSSFDAIQTSSSSEKVKN